MDFSLSSYYNAFDVEKDYAYDSLGIEAKLETITTTLAHSTEVICHNHDVFEDIVEMAHGFLHLGEAHKKQVTYLICSSFSNACNQSRLVLELGDFLDSVASIRAELERYGYLMFVLLSFLGKEDFPTSGASRLKQTSSKWKLNCSEVEDALDAVVACMKVPLSKVFLTTPERLQFLEMFTRPTFYLMELSDRMKIIAIKTLMFRVVALAVTQHSLAHAIQNLIIQSLTYYVHLPVYMAELLHFLSTQYDHIALTEDLLRELSLFQFNSNDTNGPKSVSEFLIKLSELSPRLILKQMSSTAQLLDNSNQSLRCSVVETCGNIVVDILKTEAEALESADDTAANSTLQVDGLLNLLEERFLDQNPFVRTKAIQAMVKVCSLPIRIPKRRHSVMLIAVRSLGDRSTLVRRNAIKLMYKLLLSHPFSAAHGTQLNYDVWRARLDTSEVELQKYLPKAAPHKRKESSSDAMEVDQPAENEAHDEEDEDSDIDHEELNNSIMEQELSLPDKTTLIKAQLTTQYYRDAIEFIEAVEAGTSITSNLLFSKNRNEVLESMDFLVLADAHGIRNSADGIRRMLHLVWMKGTTDEGKSVSAQLIDCYKDLFLTAPHNATMSQAAVLGAKNLIGLTIDASMADLASLERLLGLMYEEKLIGPEIIKVLWIIYGKAGSDDPDYKEEHFHGAIQILGMLALVNSAIVHMGLESLLRIGLGEIGKNDMVLCKHTCATILKLVPATNTLSQTELPQQDEILSGLQDTLLFYTEKPEWFSVAEQSLDAIFRISSSPDKICQKIITEKANSIFKDIDPDHSQAIALSQLVFLIGHVAIKTIEYLEKLETHFKKKKHEFEAKKSGTEKDGEENELEMIGGTSEDDFTDAVIYVKERELLYGESSILAKFAPIVREICMSRLDFDNVILQRAAVLSLAKLMCVSSKFCEENLPLLITIMEKSPDPIIRCNCVLGLGDMAVCFNNLVDENTDFLYRRLTDDNLMVQRTCLMTVTFLILAGQVKVKGQLSSMAKCLENPDQGISDMCKLFFTELATKDNAIYNGFIDIFSGLSNDAALDKSAMKRIVKFLVSFIEKEKHQKQLAEKLLVRLMKCQTETEWDDVAFVLTTIPFKNDGITQALEGGYKMVLARD